MNKVIPGCKVKVHYTGTLQDGTVFDSSLEREPLAFTVGAGQMIAGFDQGVVGMVEGEEKTIVIPADMAYGEIREDLVFAVPRENMPEDYVPSVGDQLAVTSSDGHPFPVTVKEIDEETVTLDGNHALAGKDLTFAVKMIEVLSA